MADNQNDQVPVANPGAVMNVIPAANPAIPPAYQPVIQQAIPPVNNPQAQQAQNNQNDLPAIQPEDPPNVEALRKRIEGLEKGRMDTVEGVLSRIFQLVRARDVPFSKDVVFDLVLSLKLVAKESNHPRAGYYSAVLQAVREKMAVPNEQFKDYIVGLLGDKEENEVFNKMSKVDKAKVGTELVRPSGRGRARAQPYQV